MIVKKLTISRLLNDVQQCTPQWGVQATERSCVSKMEGLRPDKFQFLKLRNRNLRRQSTMKKAIIMMIVVFALVVWPFSGVWQLLSGIIGGGVRESFIYPIYGGIILLSGIIVVCTELILEEIKSLKDDIKDKKEGC